MSGRTPPLYCTLTLIAMQGHQKNSENKNIVVQYIIKHGSNIYCHIGCEDKATTWYYITQLIEVVNWVKD